MEWEDQVFIFWIICVPFEVYVYFHNLVIFSREHYTIISAWKSHALDSWLHNSRI
jgi:hypothetical protein